MTGIDFLLDEYVDKLVIDKTLASLIVNRNDIEKHLRDRSLYYIANDFIEHHLSECTLINSKLMIQLTIIFDIIVNNIYKLLINPDDTNFQLFSLILNSTLVMDIENIIEAIYDNKKSSGDEYNDERKSVTDIIMDKLAGNLVKNLDQKEINPDVYTANVRIDLIKSIFLLLK